MSDSKEVIQDRLLSNISDEYDKSEGSFFYDAEMPVSIELESAYADQEDILSKGFVDTATGEYLDKLCAEQGIARKQATYSTTTVNITGTIGANINKGDLVASNTVNFEFTENKTIGATGIETVNVQCTQIGSVGNVIAGAIKYFPKTLSGLVLVTNQSTVTNGYDAETDESLRSRYYAKVQTPATSGNKYHYINWAKEVTGVGDCKVSPLWNGNGTVKVVIINSNKRAADSTLIFNVISHIEENRPIGATVTVVSASEKAIDISATLLIDTKKYTLNQTQMALEANLTNYFASIAFVNNYVSYASIGNIIFNLDGVIDYSNLLINEGTSNITLQDEEIPILGTVSLGV